MEAFKIKLCSRKFGFENSAYYFSMTFRRISRTNLIVISGAFQGLQQKNDRKS